MKRLSLFAVLFFACGGEPPPPEPGTICWATLSNRMAYLAGWLSKEQCGIAENTGRQAFGLRHSDGTCSVAFDIEGGQVGRFHFSYFPETQVAQVLYNHASNPNDRVVNAWPCPKELFQ